MNTHAKQVWSPVVSVQKPSIISISSLEYDALMRDYKRAAIIVAIPLIIIISYTLLWKPEEQTTHALYRNNKKAFINNAF